MEKKYLSEKTLADRWDISHRTLQDWRHDKSYNLPFVRIGRRVLYKVDVIEACEAENFHNLITKPEKQERGNLYEKY